ncbi:MAG: CoA ester lyase [Candidatus Bathyarchaeia archaeon]
MILRSLLFTPGNSMRMIDKASRLETDAVILDLEDAVPVLGKETARIFVRDVVDKKRGDFEEPFPHLKSREGLYICVRINSLPSGLYLDDLASVVVDGLDGVMVPKVESEQDVKTIEKLLGEREETIGLEKGGINIIPLIETAKGVLNVREIVTASERVIALGFGAVDFAADAHIAPSRERIELLYPRSYLSLVAHACGVQPIDTPWVDIQDRAGFIEDCEKAKRLGFTGKMAVHPTQLRTINQVFSPSKSEVDYARKVVEAFNKAASAGVGATFLGGKMIDLANLRQAKEVLRLAEEAERGRASGRNLRRQHPATSA